MVNGNVLERGKRDKLGHRGSKGLAGPQPAPLGCSPGWRGVLARLGGLPGVTAVPREPQHRAPSPAGFPARLWPHGRVLGMAGTELGHVCTQIRVERLGARVPLGASRCHPWLCTGLRWHWGVPEGFWGERCWGVTRGARIGSLRWQGDVTGGCHGPVPGCDGCWHPASGVGCGVPRPLVLPTAGSRGPKRWVVSLCCLLIQPLPDLRMAEVKFSLFALV